LIKVTIDDVTKEMQYVEARLKCIDDTMSSDVKMLIKVLSEIREYDLAMELAFAYKTTVAYPLLC
jgi:hypothetical protein